MKNRDRALAFALLALATATAAGAQDFPGIARGFEPQKAYQVGEIENVSLFSGGLTLTIPLGNSYPVGPDFKLGFTLVYNSHLWRYLDTGSSQYAAPLELFNAGIGWNLSPGELLHPDDVINESNPSTWVYIDSSGARHDFYDRLHAGDSATTNRKYSRDGSYLRLDLSANPKVQFPDGSEHEFETDPDPPSGRPLRRRLKSMKDAFGNTVTMTYSKSVTLNTRTWTFNSPGTFNTMEMIFDTSGATAGFYANRGGVLKQLRTRTTGGGWATHSFTYTTATISPGNGCASNQGPPVSLPFLTRVTLPQGATWEMPWADGAYDTTGTGCSGNPIGLIRKLTVPTKGKLEWGWGSYLFPNFLADRCRDALYNQVALAERRHLDRNGALLGKWTYSQALNKFPTCSHTLPPNPPEYSIVTVVSPLGDATESFFGVDIAGPPELYGFPGDTANPPTSSKIYEGGVSAANLKRTNQVRYEWDGGASGPDTGVSANQRLAFTNTIYHDDGDKFASTTYSDFDGFGHYRRTKLAGSFGAGDARDSILGYNPTIDSFPSGGTGGGEWTWPAASKWLLGTYSEKKVCEAGSFNAAGESCSNPSLFAREQFCFDATNGFLSRHRVLQGTNPGANDVLTLFGSGPGGFVTSEAYHGGDNGNLGAASDLCAEVALGVEDYRIDHTYQARVRATSQYAGVSFKSLDSTIDPYTGLPTIDRDPAGLATSLEYDQLGRLTWTKPAAGHGAWTQIIYTNADFVPGNPPPVDIRASVGIKRRDNGVSSGAPLADTSIVFDDLGRVYREFVVLADGRSGRRQTTYNAMGWKDKVSEQATPTEGNINTIYGNYDPFGRPRGITPSDGGAHFISLSYAGDRVITRTVPIGTGRNATTGEVIKEQVTTTEIYDRQSRLSQVQEYSGVGSALTTTLYKYDEAARLREASTNFQVRTFNYDGRGFLTTETHPEKGVTGSGTVTYGGFDARGHATTKVDGPFNLTYAFDRAERLLSIRETGGQQRLLKEWQYDTGSWAGLHALGKATQAIRHNWVEIPWEAPGTVIDVLVTEQNTYSGRDGRVSARSTSTSVGGTNFTQSWIYNALGQVTSLTYPNCTHANCTGSLGAASPRTVGMTYTNGWLTGITGFASLTYHSNGLVNQILHSNGVTDTQDNDPSRMRRPQNIRTTASALVLGPYKYDGAGNITDIGNNRFLYDKVSRIKSYAFESGQKQDYSYDAFGNLTAITTSRPPASPVTQTFSILGLTNHLSAAAYDGAGNQTSWGPYTYAYDAFGMMTRMRGNGNDNTHVYTAADERLWTVDYDGASIAGNVETFLLRDLDGKPLREYKLLGGDAVGHWSRSRDYIYRDAGHLLASIAPGNAVSHYTLDHLGSPRLVTNNTGGYVSDHHYFAYGEELSPSTLEVLKFTGHERDFNESGQGTTDDLDYMHARYYSPVTGRFLGVDPLGGTTKAPQGWNRYAYSRGNPLKFVDPDGQKEKPFDANVDIPRTKHEGTATPISRSMPFSLQREPYNCHSYSWHGGKGDPTDPGNKGLGPNWDNSPADDMKEATKLDANAPNEAGDIVVYGTDANFDGELSENEIDHSATVIEVDAEGNTTRVEGKEGQAEITDHHPSDQNPGYGNFKEWYRQKGQPRKKDKE